MAKAEQPATVLVVLDSFTGEVNGESVNFIKGQAIEPDHPGVRKWPDKFGPFTFPYPVKRRAEPRIEQATAGPGEKRGA